MTIYIDECRHKKGIRFYCHMMTDQDDLEELHAMAKRCGLNARWFQDHPAHPHYDLTTSRRRRAIRAGVKAVKSTELVTRCSYLFKNDPVYALDVQDENGTTPAEASDND